MVNVLHVSRTMGQGGAEKVVYQLCKDMHTVTPYVASCGGAYADELKKRKIKHIRIPDIDIKNPLLIIKTISILYNAIRKNNIDIIHTHHRMAAFYGRILQIVLPGIKHVYTAHNVFYGKKGLMRFALSKAEIVACGNTVKKNLENEYGINKSKIKVVFNSIEPPVETDESDRNETLDELNGILVGCIGRISKQKGFDIFVSAISIAIRKNPKIMGVLIGDGEDREIIEKLVDKLDIKSNIRFLGYRKDVPQLIKKLSFAVLPSRWEGFPLTPIEVFSAQKTIICSDIDNNLEIVQDGKNGLVFQKENVNDLAEKIICLAENDVLRNKLEKQAFDDYKSIYKYDLFIKKYSEVYKGAMRHNL